MLIVCLAWWEHVFYGFMLGTRVIDRQKSPIGLRTFGIINQTLTIVCNSCSRLGPMLNQGWSYLVLFALDLRVHIIGVISKFVSMHSHEFVHVPQTQFYVFPMSVGSKSAKYNSVQVAWLYFHWARTCTFWIGRVRVLQTPSYAEQYTIPTR